MQEKLIRWIRRIPGARLSWHIWKRIWNPLSEFLDKWVNGVLHLCSPFGRLYPPGYHYSSLPSKSDVSRAISFYEMDIDAPVEGLDINHERQLEVLDEVHKALDTIPFPDCSEEEYRFYFSNGYYQWCDATLLYGLLLYLRPMHIIEVGSGYSSALMLDARDLNNEIVNCLFTFIEPYPTRLHSLLKDNDKVRCRIIEKPVQQVGLSLFEQLRSGDFLFIDSSHVLKAGSDLCFLLFEVMTRIRSGVWVHFHDIFWPFEYPREWFQQGRAWNEAYAIRAFLQFNEEFEIMLFVSYLQKMHTEALYRLFPTCARDLGSSLWLRRR